MAEILRYRSEDINACRRWLRHHGFICPATQGWVRLSDNAVAAITWHNKEWHAAFSPRPTRPDHAAGS